MKDNKKCPKCESIDIIKIPGGDAWVQRNAIPLGAFQSFVFISRYVCGTCGYTEEWIENNEDLARLKNKFQK